MIFKRDLNEAHLLMEFLSGRADNMLHDLTLPDPNRPSHVLASSEVVRRLSLLRYPPSPNEAVKAADASFLLLAKDRRSRLAAPVRGTTIAYTAMFADSAQPLVYMLFDCLTNSARRGQRPRRADDARLSLAIETFPGLRSHALLFRRTFSSLPVAALLFLLITLLTYWQVALSQSVLQRMGQLYKERVTLIEANPDLVAPGTCPDYQAGGSAAPVQTGESARLALACYRLRSLERSRDDALRDLWQSACVDTRSNLVSNMLGWGAVLCKKSGSPRETVDWQSATSVLTVVSTYVLPMMFAVLGALIAVTRNVHAKVRDSELAPRDRMLMLLGVPMGAIAGVAVSLFFSPTLVIQATPPSGNLTLTASGLGFLAGYGAEAFFRFVDSLLRRVFPERDSGPALSAVPAPQLPASSVPQAPKAMQPGQSSVSV